MSRCALFTSLLLPMRCVDLPPLAPSLLCALRSALCSRSCCSRHQPSDPGGARALCVAASTDPGASVARRFALVRSSASLWRSLRSLSGRFQPDRSATSSDDKCRRTSSHRQATPPATTVAAASAAGADRLRQTREGTAGPTLQRKASAMEQPQTTTSASAEDSRQHTANREQRAAERPASSAAIERGQTEPTRAHTQADSFVDLLLFAHRTLAQLSHTQ